MNTVVLEVSIKISYCVYIDICVHMYIYAHDFLSPHLNLKLSRYYD